MIAIGSLLILLLLPLTHYNLFSKSARAIILKMGLIMSCPISLSEMLFRVNFLTMASKALYILLPHYLSNLITHSFLSVQIPQYAPTVGPLQWLFLPCEMPFPWVTSWQNFPLSFKDVQLTPSQWGLPWNILPPHSCTPHSHFSTLFFMVLILFQHST